MLTRRIVVCLDVDNGRVVKGTRFESLRDIGDPVVMAEAYERAGADEIIFLDISATAGGRATLLDVARRTAERLFIPLVIGGGVRSADGVARALRSGADKVSINSAAVARPALITEAAERFGAQCVVASIDAKVSGAGRWEVFVRSGRQPTGLDAVEWAARCVALGAGELLVTSIDRDGSRTGYDVELTAAITERVSVPVIASGGAGRATDVADVFRGGNAAAALVAGIVHDGLTTIDAIKAHLAGQGIPVRSAA